MTTAIATVTRTHTGTTFANPSLVCGECDAPVMGVHRGDKNGCGCGMGDWLLPCRHAADAFAVCLSWSPVDGCACPGGHTTPDAPTPVHTDRSRAAADAADALAEQGHHVHYASEGQSQCLAGICTVLVGP